MCSISFENMMAFENIGAKSAGAVILAAGFSKRMGRFKPLLPLGSTTVLERVVRLFQSAGINRICVVTGHREKELAPLIQSLGALAISNPRYEKGMFSSVTAGVERLDEKTKAFFMLPADIPLVRKTTLMDLLKAFPADTSGICHPVFDGKRGHPPLIGKDHIPSIINWKKPGGLAALLARASRHFVDVPVVDEFIHKDMDTPDAYNALIRSLPDREALSFAECAALLGRLKTPPAVAAHCRAVAHLALEMGKALNTAGFSLNLNLIRAAALVHDMARIQPNHAKGGRKSSGAWTWRKWPGSWKPTWTWPRMGRKKSGKPRWFIWRTNW